MPRDSRIILGAPADVGRAATVFAYGDGDDPVRLVVLLADRVLTLVEADSEAAQQARACLDPQSTWRERLRSLGSAIHDATGQHDEPVLALWDVDAIAAEQPENWEHERATLQRRDLSLVIREAAREGGWLLIRTAPERGVGGAFDDLDVPRETASSDAALPEEARLFAPDCWKVASYLVNHDVLRTRDLAEVCRTVPNPEEHLVDLAYQSLPSAARDGATLLTTLRAPQSLNGHFGRVAFSPSATEASATALPASTRPVLLDAGLVQRTWTNGPWRIPRFVRKRLLSVAHYTVRDQIQTLHRLEAESADSQMAQQNVAAAVEAHFHAVCTGDIHLAMKTAVFYGSELSEIGRRLSLEAQATEDEAKRQALFLDAAGIFKHVKDHFDRDDAYAWEYFAYNLARAKSPEEATILDAYRRAHQLRRGNPLYHGRYLGYRGQLGQRVVEEAVSAIFDYAVDSRGVSALRYFADAVMRGLNRGGQRNQANEIVHRCGRLLEALTPDVKINWAR